ncbi:hypothetical protein Slin15195_G082420 [Septoria linicola]|uniref:PARP catalytic domain-containing protein n=1 Tax=Septoria linicola TaxID=215465 RepID=A0A9Q9AXC2_9PEZI|nr:hypothetical protein Slin15195_G082420 [Septoria linicola]
MRQYQEPDRVAFGAAAESRRKQASPPGALSRYNSSGLFTIADADRMLEQHLPKEVSHHSGSLQEGQLDFGICGGTLCIAVDVRMKRITACTFKSDHCCTRESVPKTLETRHSVAELAIHVLQLLEEHIASPWNSLLKRLKTTGCRLTQVLETTARAICDEANPSQYGWRFFKAKRITCSRLQQRFQDRISAMRQELEAVPLQDIELCVPESQEFNSKASMIEHMLTPRHTFHGTNSAILDGIAKWGLLAPGDIHPATGQQLGKRLGSTYGPGVYTTQEPHLAIAYSNWSDNEQRNIDPSERAPGAIRKSILICVATLRRAALLTQADGFRYKTELYSGAQSHVANSGQEYVLPKEQVLPLYIVAFDWVPENEEQRRAYIRYAESMVSPPEDDLEKLGRWSRGGE